MFHFLLIFAFLMFFSSFARLDKLMFEFVLLRLTATGRV
jgi:hypothetical protein